MTSRRLLSAVALLVVKRLLATKIRLPSKGSLSAKVLLLVKWLLPIKIWLTTEWSLAAKVLLVVKRAYAQNLQFVYLGHGE